MHAKEDGEAYDRYVAELGTVVRLLKKWLLRAPPNVGSRVSAIPKLLSLGRDMAGLSLAETRIVHDFAVRSAGESFLADLDSITVEQLCETSEKLHVYRRAGEDAG